MTRATTETAISPRDVTGRFVTDRFSPDMDPRAIEARAARTITAGVRKSFQVRRLAGALFSGKTRAVWDNELTLPAALSHLIEHPKVHDVLGTVTHVSDHLPDILHAGRLYPKVVVPRNGIGILGDAEKGDNHLVSLSASGFKYHKNNFIEIDIKALMQEKFGNLYSSVFFKFYDILKVSSMQKKTRFSITENLHVNVRRDPKSETLLWRFSFQGYESFTVNPRKSDYFYQGYDELSQYITFFIFEVLSHDSVDPGVRDAIYDHCARINPEELIGKLHALFREFFTYAEFGFTAPVNLALPMIKKLKLDDVDIEFDDLRTAIEKNNLDFIVEFFSNETVKRYFSQSYFIISDMLSMAEQAVAVDVSAYLRAQFSNTLALPEQVVVIKAQGPVATQMPMILTDTRLQEQLTQDAVTPFQLNRFVAELAMHPAKIGSFLNINKDKVITFIEAMRGVFSSFASASTLGFQTTLKQQTVGNEAFRALFSDQENIQMLLYLAAIGDHISGLDPKIQQCLERPLFSTGNSFTSLGLEGHFYGIRNKGVGLNRVLLADVLMTVPPMLLFVPDNGVSEKQFDISKAISSIRFYQQLFDHLKAIALAHDHDFSVDRDTPVLEEKYDASQWSEYYEYFLTIFKRCSGFSNIDALGSKLLGLTAEGFIEKKLCLNEYYRHFALDPAHLKSVFANDYGKFCGIFTTILNIFVRSFSHEKEASSFALRVAGIQFFYSLKLLEDRLDIDARLAALSSSVEEVVGVASSRQFDHLENNRQKDVPLPPTHVADMAEADIGTEDEAATESLEDVLLSDSFSQYMQYGAGPFPTRARVSSPHVGSKAEVAIDAEDKTETEPLLVDGSSDDDGPCNIFCCP